MGFAGTNLVIGHRGAAGLAPENTLDGFRRAVALGVDAVELDVHALDGAVVVIHDDALDRTTSGRGPLQAQSLAALRRLDAGGGQRVPLLQEVFAALPVNVGVNVELKGRGTAELAVPLAAAEMARGRDLLISSFDLDELGRAAALGGAALKIAPLFGRWPRQGWRVARALRAWSVNLSLRTASRRLVEEAGERGLKTLIYTVNDRPTADRLIDWGATGVFTDHPDLLISG
ncbi:MAG: glycerophosphodiester phosphodiesterase family protein [Gammaproteobacteria bacterium]|nr:glycerophosphodiester phosphodiesterase family protein [Gammaproteobacteria bacterium]